jgi:hypothetical protein
VKQVWVLVGACVVAAAGAAVFMPSSQPTVEVPELPEIPAESRGPTRMSNLTASINARGLPSGLTSSPSAGRSAFAPLGESRSPGTKTGQLRAPEPSRITDAAERQRQAAQKASGVAPAPVPPPRPNAATTTTTTGITPAPNAAFNTAGNAQAAQAAAVEQKRQQLETARRQRLAESSARSLAMAQSQRAANINQISGPEASADSGRNADANRNGPPTLEQIIADNPWLADYAPGGRYAGGSGTSGSGNSGGSNSGGSNNGGSNSGGSNSGGSNSGGSNGSGSGGSGSGGSGSNGSGTNNGGGTVIGGGGGGLVPNGPITVTPRWVTVDNRACTSLAGHRTNDLYLRVSAAVPILSVDLSGNNGLALTGGVFKQATGGRGDRPVAPATGTIEPCLSLDTFLNGGTDYSLLPGNADSDAFPAGNRVTGSLFNFTGVAGKQNSALFGDDGLYVYVGRFSAPTTITNFAGTIVVGSGAAGSFRETTVSIPFEPAIWQFDANFGAPAANNGGGNNGGGNNGGGNNGGGNNGGGNNGGGNNGGGNNGGGNNGGGNNGGGNSGGGNNGGGSNPPPVDDPCSSDPGGLTAVWRVVDNNGCVDTENGVDLRNFRTADLFVRMKRDASAPNAAPFRLQYIFSGDLDNRGDLPLTVTGGRFHQDLSGGDFPPFASDVQGSVADEVPPMACLAYDTYVTLDTGATENPGDAATPSTILFGVTQTTIGGFWVVPNFLVASAVPAVAEPVRFASDPCGRYVRVGRFTITRGASLSGTIHASIVLLGQNAVQLVRVPVPNCATCWGEPAPATP